MRCAHRAAAIARVVAAIAALGVIVAPGAHAACTLDGSGTSTDPHRIGTAAQMAQLGLETADGCGLDRHYLLTADIDMAEAPEWNGAGAYDTNDGTVAFTGSLDGAGHTIRNLRGRGDDHYGLFRRTASGAVIENLTVDGFDLSAGDVSPTGPNYRGTIVGEHTVVVFNVNQSLTLRNVHVTRGAVAGRSGGGLVGGNTASATVNLLDVSFRGIVTMYDSAGGLYTAVPGTLNVTGAYVEGTVTSTVGFAGGVAGRASGGGLESITVHANVSAGTGSVVGGVVGQWADEDGGAISRVDVKGDLSGGGIVGGVVGFLEYTADLTLRRAVYRGTISGVDASLQIGGLIGRARSTAGTGVTLTVEDAYAYGHVVLDATTGAFRVGGLVGTHVRLAQPATLHFVRTLGAMHLFSDGTDGSARPRPGTPTSTYGTGGLLGVAEPGTTITASSSYHRPNTGGNGAGVVMGSVGYHAATGVGNTDPVAGTRLALAPDQALAVLPASAPTGWGTATTWRPHDPLLQPWGQTSLVNEGYPYLLFEFDADPTLVTATGSVSTATPWFGGRVTASWTMTPSVVVTPPAAAVTTTCALDGAAFAPCASPLDLDAGAAGAHRLVVRVGAPYTGGDVTLAWTTQAPPAPEQTAPVAELPPPAAKPSPVAALPKVPVAATRCGNGICVTTGFVPAGATSITQTATVAGATIKATCTIDRKPTGGGTRRAYTCTLMVSNGRWRITTEARKRGTLIARTVKKAKTSRVPAAPQRPSRVTG